MHKLIIGFSLLVAACGYGASFEELPTSRVGNWKSHYVYFYPNQTVAVDEAYSITRSKESKQLLVTGTSRSEALGVSSFSYSVELIPDEKGRYSYLFTSSNHPPQTGSIEVTSLYSTKMIFSGTGGYTISEYRMEGDAVVIGEEKTYDANGKFVYRATFRDEYVSRDDSPVPSTPTAAEGHARDNANSGMPLGRVLNRPGDPGYIYDAPQTARVLEPFQRIFPKMTGADVVKLCGNPDEIGGSGITIFIYHLQDGTSVLIGDSGSGVMYVYHVDIFGKSTPVVNMK